MKDKLGLTVEKLAAGFGRAVGVLDEVRARQIAEGLRLEHAKASVQAREHERLRRKYGDEHPRTVAAAARVAANTEYRSRLVVEYGHASTPQPEAGEGWAVDGFVRTPQGAPVKGVAVAPCDQQGQWHQELGYACTDEKGYFRLIVKAVPEKEMRVYMRAFDGEQLLESNENRLAPASGRTNRIEIVVDRKGQGECTPPGGRRGGATPPSTPKPREEAPVAEAKQKARGPQKARKKRSK